MHFRLQIVVNNDDQWIIIDCKSNVLFQVPTRTLGLQSNLGRIHLLLPVPRLLDVCRGHLPLFKGLFFQSEFRRRRKGWHLCLLNAQVWKLRNLFVFNSHFKLENLKTWELGQKCICSTHFMQHLWEIKLKFCSLFDF